MSNFWISEQAYNKLLERARTYGYISSDHTNSGLASYLNTLAGLGTTFTDNRPMDVQAASLDELLSGKFPTWNLYMDRYPRCIRLSKVTVMFFAQIAKEFGIVNKGLSDTSLTGAVLEAIGTEWLTPDKEIPYKSVKQRQSKRYWEIGF